MASTLLLVVVASLIGLYHDTNKPTEYTLKMEDGSNTHVVLQKNSKYACPLYCGVDHVHHAVICENDNQIKNNQFVYHISGGSKNDFSIYCSTKRILSMTRFVPGKKSEVIPDVINASIDE